MKALLLSSLLMTAIANSVDAFASSSTSDRTTEFGTSELVTARQYQTQSRQYGGGTGRREILSHHQSYLFNA